MICGITYGKSSSLNNLKDMERSRSYLGNVYQRIKDVLEKPLLSKIASIRNKMIRYSTKIFQETNSLLSSSIQVITNNKLKFTILISYLLIKLVTQPCSSEILVPTSPLSKTNFFLDHEENVPFTMSDPASSVITPVPIKSYLKNLGKSKSFSDLGQLKKH